MSKKLVLLLIGSVSLANASLLTAAEPPKVVTATPAYQRPLSAADYAAATARALPVSPRKPQHGGGRRVVPTFAPQRAPSVRVGAIGSGKLSPETLFNFSDALGVAPQQYGGSSQHPFTTSRADPQGLKVTAVYPFRAAGKLFFRDGGGSYLCSASLIGPGLVVTAGHCVSEYGEQRYFTDFSFVPAYDSGNAPFGTHQAAQVLVLDSYYSGTSDCAEYGVVCPDDVALIVLKPGAGKRRRDVPVYAGVNTGYLGVGLDGFGFVTPDGGTDTITMVTQLGYPVALDGGRLMQRTDSQGYVDDSSSGNTVIGSLQTGGSSGGPWIVNFGVQPVLSGISQGVNSTANMVVGVTSWGYTDSAVKEQGASSFTADNMGVLISQACTATPAACAP